MFCPKCGCEYREGFYECADCKISLVKELPDKFTAKPFRNRLIGFLFRVIGLLLAIICVVIYFSFFYIDTDWSIPWYYKIFIFCLVTLIGLQIKDLYTLGHQLMPSDAEKILTKDTRQPIVLLRSFSHDEYESPNLKNVIPDDLSLLFGFFYKTDEEILAKIFIPFGPFIAIGRPGERISPPGAARIYVSNEGWQKKVQDLIKRSQLVILKLSNSEGFFGEFKCAIQLSRPEKVLLLLYSPHLDYKIIHSFENEYEKFRKRVKEFLPYPLPEKTGGAIFIGFEEGWKPKLMSVPMNSGHYSVEELYWSALEPIFKPNENNNKD